MELQQWHQCQCEVSIANTCPVFSIPTLIWLTSNLSSCVFYNNIPSILTQFLGTISELMMHRCHMISFIWEISCMHVLCDNLQKENWLVPVTWPLLAEQNNKNTINTHTTIVSFNYPYYHLQMWQWACTTHCSRYTEGFYQSTSTRPDG